MTEKEPNQPEKSVGTSDGHEEQKSAFEPNGAQFEPLEAMIDEASLDSLFDEKEEEISRLTQERGELANQVVRGQADFQNFRRRAEQQRLEDRKYAIQDFATSLLPVLDNFERSNAALLSGASVESVMDGIRMVERQLRQALESNGIKRVATVGSQFDPNVHEAIATEISDYPDGIVLQEVEAGYIIQDKVIRPARVKVSQKA